MLVKDGGVAALDTSFKGLAVERNVGAGGKSKSKGEGKGSSKLVKNRFVQLSDGRRFQLHRDTGTGTVFYEESHTRKTLRSNQKVFDNSGNPSSV